MKAFWCYLGVLGFAAGAFFFVPANTWPHDLLQVALGWTVAASVVVSVRCRRPTGAAAWYLFAGGVFLNASGILVAWIVTRAYGASALGSPALPNIFWLGLYPCLITGMGLLVRRMTASRDRTPLVDTTTITTGLALVSWVCVIRPLASDPTLSVLARMELIAYPIGDVIVLALMVRLLLGGAKRNPATVAAGTHAIQLTYKGNPNRAQLSFSVDGVQLGGIVDEFATGAAAGTFITKLIGSVTFASAGPHTFRLTVTGRNPANTTGFILSADKFTVGRATATILLGNLNQAYDGSPKSVSAMTTPAGLNTVITYSANWFPPTAVGVYQVIARIHDPNFIGTTSSTLVIAPASASLAVGNLVQEWDGAARIVTATTSPPGLP